MVLSHSQKVHDSLGLAPAFPQNVTNCQRARDSTRQMPTLLIVTAHRAAAFLWDAFRSMTMTASYENIISGVQKSAGICP